MGSGGQQGRQEAAEVEAEAPGGQQDRLPPFFPQYGSDRVAFGQQPCVEAGQRRAVAAGDPVSQSLCGTPGCCQRPVCAQDDRAADREQEKPGDADEGDMG